MRAYAPGRIWGGLVIRRRDYFSNLNLAAIKCCGRAGCGGAASTTGSLQVPALPRALLSFPPIFGACAATVALRTYKVGAATSEAPSASAILLVPVPGPALFHCLVQLSANIIFISHQPIVVWEGVVDVVLISCEDGVAVEKASCDGDDLEETVFWDFDPCVHLLSKVCVRVIVHEVLHFPSVSSSLHHRVVHDVHQFFVILWPFKINFSAARQKDKNNRHCTSENMVDFQVKGPT